MEKKFFLVFGMHSDVEKQFSKMGFVEHDNGKSYRYDGSDWIEIEPSEFFGAFIFSRCPAPAFDELWNLFIYSKDEGNRIGAICCILKYHYIEFKKQWERLSGIQHKDRASRKALKILSELYFFEMSGK